MRIPIKPLSVNEAWMGKTTKTTKLRKYQADVVNLLKPMRIPDGPLEIEITWGLSSMGGDFDNPIKPFVDCLQAKYGFNDNRIHRAVVEKVKTRKGEEFIEFSIRALNREAA